jgi:hypothetical protein
MSAVYRILSPSADPRRPSINARRRRSAQLAVAASISLWPILSARRKMLDFCYCADADATPVGREECGVGGGRENFVLLPIIPLPAKTKLPTARAGKVGAQDSSGGPATPVAPPLCNARSSRARSAQSKRSGAPAPASERVQIRQPVSACGFVQLDEKFPVAREKFPDTALEIPCSVA